MDDKMSRILIFFFQIWFFRKMMHDEDNTNIDIIRNNYAKLEDKTKPKSENVIR